MALRWCGGDKLLNKVVIFVFFAYKKYFRRFIKFRLNHWWQMDYFDNFSGPWQCYLFGSQWDSHKPPGFHPKYLKLCSEDEQSFYRFGTTWGYVINDKIFILGWSNPLRQTTENNRGPCNSKNDAKGAPWASKSDAKWSWPSFNMWRVGSENVLNQHIRMISEWRL